MTYSDGDLQKNVSLFCLFKWGCWSLTKAEDASYETVSVRLPIRLFICLIINQKLGKICVF